MKELVATLIKKYYQLEGKLERLPGDLDLNFKLTTFSGVIYILKIMRPDCDPSLIDLQCAALKYLQKEFLTIETPKVIYALDGSAFNRVSFQNEERILWVLSYCDGHLLAQFKPHTEALFHNYGEAIASLTNALEGFQHPAMKRRQRWELSEALQSEPFVPHISDEVQAIVANIFKDFRKNVLPELIDLPHSVIHNDANDYNILIKTDERGKLRVSGIFDFGDMSFQASICEVAIALAYLILEKEHPLRVCFHFLKGYSKTRLPGEAELAVLFPLIKTRLAVSIAISSKRQLDEPDDPYIVISQKPAISALKKLDKIPDDLAHAFLRVACAYPATDQIEHVLHFIKNSNPFPAIKADQFNCVLDLSAGSLLIGADPENMRLESLSHKIRDFMNQQNANFSIGRYCESRRLYAAANFGDEGHPCTEKRCIHLGIDIFCDAGTPVYAAFPGELIVNTVINLPLDYGGLLIIKHQTDQGIPFYTLYGHLKPESLKLEIGQSIQAGQEIALLGAPHENGGWPPHLHLQIISDLLGLEESFPGVAYQSEIAVWRNLCPNPMLLFQVENADYYDASVDLAHLLDRRRQKLGYNLGLSYEKPLHIVSGFRQYLYDSHANTYLDFYNNVPHVGHQHPRVVKAIQEQIALLNTNTRYLHENILQYAEALTAKLPQELEVCYFVNSASEANELAIRIARAYTNRHDIMVVEAAYHGHTSTLIDLSPYKHNGPGGDGAPDWVHTVSVADTYRGAWKADDPEAAKKYSDEVKEKLSALAKNGKGLAAFIAETYPSVGGQIIPPKNYLKFVYQHIREYGGLCIADEVQTGFGRLGKSFWAFETQNATPDILVLGKPIANGFPLGAVITTKAIAKAFDNGMEYFSTFGGNPVSCAAGLAVLETIEAESLQKNADTKGQVLLDFLNTQKQQYPCIGDVRGEGLFMGIELVKNRETLTPATELAAYIVNRLKDHYILAGTDGPLHNVIKLRPSMVIEDKDIHYFKRIFSAIMEETVVDRIR